MKTYQDALPHGKIEEVFEHVFFVTGSMKNEFFGSMWQFSRNMTVVLEDGKLSIINSVRLNEEGLAELEKLGVVTNVIRIGDMHGVDDPFYVDRYHAKFWALPGMKIQEGLNVDHELVESGVMPFGNSSFFNFATVKRPEGIIRLDQDGGIMIACDSLQNWVEPDEFFGTETIETMKKMDFFVKANLGLAWLHESQPQAEDFVRLKEIRFEHTLCGHGYPFISNAMSQYHQTINKFFKV